VDEVNFKIYNFTFQHHTSGKATRARIETSIANATFSHLQQFPADNNEEFP